jgi:HPt (histidine-containing phosphotransfer) domain-containing protein
VSQDFDETQPMTRRTHPALDPDSLTSLRELADDDPSFLTDLLAVYIQQSDMLVATANDALAAADVDAWSRAVHSIGGSSRNIGALQLAAVCTAAEKLAREGNGAGSFVLIKRLKTEYEAVKGEIHLLRAVKITHRTDGEFRPIFHGFVHEGR